jgi:hypothetical protein
MTNKKSSLPRVASILNFKSSVNKDLKEIPITTNTLLNKFIKRRHIHKSVLMWLEILLDLFDCYANGDVPHKV